jgi:hypothetical protein
MFHPADGEDAPRGVLAAGGLRLTVMVTDGTLFRRWQ